MISVLMNAKADWSATDAFGKTPGDLAHAYGHHDTFDELQPLPRRAQMFSVLPKQS
jgi:hypothetical protein